MSLYIIVKHVNINTRVNENYIEKKMNKRKKEDICILENLSLVLVGRFCDTGLKVSIPILG